MISITMTEKVYFKNSKGDKLCGILSNPTTETDCPIVILCHGFTTSKDSSTSVALEKRLNEKEIATLRLDFFGHGESEGNFAEITVSEGVDDALCAIDFLKSKGFSKIGIYGGSYGGSVGLMAASKNNDLYVLALKAPVSDWKDKIFHKGDADLEEWRVRGWKEHTNSAGKVSKLNFTFFEDFDNNNSFNVADNITVPTIIIHGDKDKSVPVEQSIRLDSMLPDSRLEILKGTDHFFSEPENFQKMIDFITDFIVKHSK